MAAGTSISICVEPTILLESTATTLPHSIFATLRATQRHQSLLKAPPFSVSNGSEGLLTSKGSLDAIGVDHLVMNTHENGLNAVV